MEVTGDEARHIRGLTLMASTTPMSQEVCDEHFRRSTWGNCLSSAVPR
jgi:hypothetical protein